MRHHFIKLVSLSALLLLIPGRLPAQTSFHPSYSDNRGRACIHCFFSFFDKNPRDAEKILSLLVSGGGLELNYPWGSYRSREEFKNWIAALPNDFQDAHHITDLSVILLGGNRTKAVARVLWQNHGPEGKSDHAWLEYVFELEDNGDVLPKIQKIDCRRVTQTQDPGPRTQETRN